MSRDPLWTGITRHGTGYRAQVYGGHGRPPVRRQFPAGTSPQEMQRWRADTQATLHLTRTQRATMGAFSIDAANYLAAVAALPTIAERRRIIAFWIGEFGTMPRDRITALHIRTIRDRLLTEPRSIDDTRPLAPGTVNVRLRALSNLFAVLDGRRAVNPVREVPEAIEPDAQPRALGYETIAALIDALSDEGSVPLGTKRRGHGSKTKIRIACLAYCPITPSQLKTITRDDLDLANGRLRLPARHKGAGRPAAWSPLVPQAVAAFTAFDQANLYGQGFSNSSIGKSFKRAAKKIGLKKAPRVYDLRHSFATAAYRATQSLEAVAQLMQHGSPETTKRYAMEAEAQVAAAHGAVVVEHFNRIVGSNPSGSTVGPRPRLVRRNRDSDQ